MSKETKNIFLWVFVLIVIIIVGGLFYRDNVISHSPTSTPTQTLPNPTITPTESNEISWEEAIDNIGEFKTVCGGVVQVHKDSKSGGIFLDMGNKYPKKPRFSIVYWPEAQSSEINEAYLNSFDGNFVCVTGLIDSYDGVPQIEAKASTPIYIQN